jgi:hypothetical protein
MRSEFKEMEPGLAGEQPVGSKARSKGKIRPVIFIKVKVLLNGSMLLSLPVRDETWPEKAHSRPVFPIYS